MLRPGDYILDRPLLIDKSLALKGAGTEKTIIICSQGEHVIKITGEGKVIIQDISFEYRGNMFANVGVVLGSNTEISRCSFRGGTINDSAERKLGNGLFTDGQSKAKITDCEFKKNRGTGICVGRDKVWPLLFYFLMNLLGANHSHL